MNGTGGALRSLLRQVLSQRVEPVRWTYLVRLPSVIPEARFEAEIGAAWQPGTRVNPSLSSLAEQLLADVARSAAKDRSVLDRDEARTAINVALAADGRLRENRLKATVADLRVGTQDRTLAEKYRETELAQASARRLAGLLADPVAARLWWLQETPDRVEQLLAMDKKNLFDDLARIFAGSASEPVSPDPIAELIRIFLQGLDSRAREHLLDQLDRVFRSYEHKDLADRLGRSAGQPREPESSPLLP